MPNYRPAVVTDHYCEGHPIHIVQVSDWFYPFLRSKLQFCPQHRRKQKSFTPFGCTAMCSHVGTISFPERAVPSLPMPMQRHSEHLNHQHRTFTYREKVRSLIAERVASIEFDTKKRLRAPGENEAKCKVIRIKELEQRSTISCFGERFSPFMHGLNTIVSISQVTFSLPVSFPEPRTSLHLPAILTSYHLVMRSSWTRC